MMNAPLAAAAWLGQLGDPQIIAAVGAPTFSRGQGYARAGMVRALTLADRGRMLLAEVEGSGPRAYQTLITLTSAPGREPISWVSRCSCPMQAACKHTVAVLLHARGRYREQTHTARAPDWEELLRPLVEESGPALDNGPPLGLIVDQLPAAPSYQALMGPPRISLRPTRKTKTGGWARNFTWSELTSPHTRTPMSRTHVAALREIHDLHRLTGGRDGYYYTSAEIYLGSLGRRVWPLLHRAVESGVALIAGPNTEGDVTLSMEPVDVVLDIVREGADIVVTTSLDGSGGLGPIHNLALLGDPAHGLAIQASGGLTLVSFEHDLDAPLAALLDKQRVLRIPQGDTERFVHLYLPRLRNRATIRSRDDSVIVPEQPRPVLRVRVTQSSPRTLEVVFDMAYAASSGALLTAASEGMLPRDRSAEQSLLERLTVLDEIPAARVRRGTAYAGFWELAARSVLSGMEAVRFTDSVLPTLEGDPDIHVETVGELTSYERAAEAPIVDVGLSDSSDGRTDWFDLAVTVSVGGEQVPFEGLFRALAAGDEALLLDSGTWFLLDDPALDALRTLISEARELVEPNAPMRLTRYHIGLWDDLAELGLTTVSSEQWSRSVERLRGFTNQPPPPVPEGLRATLRPYQVEGFHWLTSLWEADLGGILADDMGLGKTVQTLALLERARAAGDLTDPVLVIAPTSMLGVWASEAARFSPDLRVVVLGETTKRRSDTVGAAVSGADLVVTSYAVVRIDEEGFTELPWRGLVLDEAQFVKNHQAKTHHVLRRIRAPFRLAMTGTPLENSLMDLWSLLALTAPGLYPRADRFTQTYRRPIEAGAAPELLDRLRNRIRPLMLRRTKEAVAGDLPPKQEQVLTVELSPVHRRLYDQNLQRERQRVLGLLDDPVANRVAILASLTRLRQLALDPALVDGTARATRGASKSRGPMPAKVEALIEQLVELQAEGHRALVFSQFTTFLQIVRGHLADAGITTEYLDGSTRNRAEVIGRFKEGDATAFLISLKAGGVGLTLTEADYVFVLDPWWNPAAESQAIDRAHRIGQDKMVMVYRLISAGTIEEKVVALQQRKRDLFERVVDEGGGMSGAITAADIRALLAAD